METNKQENRSQLTERPYRSMGFVIHIVAWGILFGIPFFFTGRETQSITWDSYIRFLLVPLSFMLVFYANYSLLIPKYLFTKHIPKFLLANALLIAFTIIAVHLLMQVLPAPHPRHHITPPLPEIIRFFFGNIMLYILVVGLSVAIRMTGSWYKVESMRRELEQARVEAELTNLKSQLNPHFLFNTLNNIYCLIAFDANKAQEAVHDLSRLLRYVLYDSSHPLVGIEREFDFIRNYVGLMKMRLPEHARVEMELSTPPPGMQIAPLLFISLIENAFKHGVSNNKSSYIRIRIIHDDKGIDCYIENSYFPKDKSDKSGSGIGLVNLKKRLNLIYPEKYLFVQEQKENSYVTDLYINLYPKENETDMRYHR